MSSFGNTSGAAQPDNLSSAALVAALDGESVFGHPVTDRRVIETHISWVVLTGRYAYKIKKPVNLGFLDFSSLENRRRYCLEELRLNRRFAPEIYLGLVEIRGNPSQPRIGGDGEVIEYAIRMLEFPQDCLLDRLAAASSLRPESVDEIAERLAAMHAESAIADSGSDYGSGALVERWSEENLTHIAAAITTEYLPGSYFRLKRWYRENPDLLRAVEARRRQGFVRDCHGDLHLGNMALIDGAVRFFDCIEFNPELRWIDTMSEAAFVAMDLHARGYPAYCWRFIDRYLEHGGDYAGIALLRYYFVYRALVRAKVEALRVGREMRGHEAYRRLIAPAIEYLELAGQWAQSQRAGLILMHGLSASGKSSVAAQLVEKTGAIRIRSDVERKRLFELSAADDSGSPVAGGIYSAAATEATYRRLVDLARTVLDAGFRVIVDAATLREAERAPFLELLADRDCRGLILSCDAPETELRRRILARENDPSEANLAVLDHQLRTREPIGAREADAAPVVCVGADGLEQDTLEAIERLLAS